MESFFIPRKEILIARHRQEVVRFLSDISETRRNIIASRARARVLAEHTAERRAQQLEGYLTELGYYTEANSAAPATANS